MENKPKFEKINFILLAIIGIMVLFGCLFVFPKSYNPAQETDKIALESPRVDILEDGSKMYRLYPDTENSYAHDLLFYTNHQEVFVYADDMLIYSREKVNTIWGHTTGSVWNMVEIPKATKEIKVNIKPVYKSNKQAIVQFYYGNGIQMYNQQMDSSVFDIVVCVLIFALGFCLTVYYLIIRRGQEQLRAILYLGIFAMFLGVWALGETKGLMFLVQNRVMASYAAYICLMGVCIPFVYFCNYFMNVEDNYFHQIVIIYCWIIGGVAHVLQFLNIRDIKQNIGFVHSMIIVAFSYFVYSTYKCFQNDNFRRRAIVNSVGVVILLMAILVDLALYYKNRLHANRVGKFGFLIYVVLLGFETGRQTHIQMDEARKMEVYHEMAIKDFQTDCYNRNAYNADSANLHAVDRYMIITFDLNNLKACNDNLGHAMGDAYITGAAGLIRDVFEEYGKVYRIGGDEFCVLAPNISEDTVKSLIKELKYKEKETEYASMEMPLGIACGYAEYDPFMDYNIEDTRERADMLMYENKKKIKK